MKAVVAAFNQEKARVGAFSVITNLRMELFETLPPVLPALPLPDRQDVALAVSALGVMLLASRRRRRRRLARLLPLLFDADGLRLNSHHCGAPRSYHVLAPGFYLTVPHCQPSTLTNLCSLSGKRCYLVLRKLGTCNWSSTEHAGPSWLITQLTRLSNTVIPSSVTYMLRLCLDLYFISRYLSLQQNTGLMVMSR